MMAEDELYYGATDMQFASLIVLQLMQAKQGLSIPEDRAKVDFLVDCIIREAFPAAELHPIEGGLHADLAD